MIKYIKSDLFESGADVICHQVNCQGVMGSGVAKQVKYKYPAVFHAYEEKCKTHESNALLGLAQLVRTTEYHTSFVGIFNLFAQDKFGYDGKCYTDYLALYKCLEAVKSYAETHASINTIALPYLMSCHRSGGDWEKVSSIIEDIFEDDEIELLICRLSEQEDEFFPRDVKNKCVRWIKNWFDKNGNGCNAVVGISGGKDSSVVAALCVEALGKDRVIGVLMPNGIQKDINCAVMLVEYLGIRYTTVNIETSVNEVLGNILDMYIPSIYGYNSIPISEQTKINLPARIRMAMLYAVSQSMNGRVANTCNLSEDWVGYATRYGDSAGDFSPLSNLTVTEVKAIGRELGLPNNLVEKVPTDGLCGKTDEDNLGFKYEVLDRYIRQGVCDDSSIKAKIDEMHEKNKFKLEPMPCFEYPNSVVSGK